MRKKVFLLGVVVAFLLTSCKREEPKLTFAVGGAPNEIEFWIKLVNEFENKTNIRMRLIRQPTDTDQRRQSLVIPLKAKQPDPDVFLMDVAWIGQFASSDWLLPIEEYVEEKLVDQFFERVVEFADKYNNTLIALPIYIDGGLLYYRKDILEKYGYAPPTTWKELVSQSLTLQELMRKDNPSFFGFVWQGAQYEGLVCTFLEFAVSNGGGIMTKDGKVIIDMDENVEALEFMVALIHQYKISPPNTFTEMKEEEVRSYFQIGNALFERNWPYAWTLHQSEGSPIKWKIGIAPLPHFDGNKSVATLGGWHIGISKYSDTKPEAVKLLKFIIDYETQKKLVLELGWNPGRKDVYQDKEVVENLPHLNILKEVFANAIARPNLPYYTRISDIIQRYVNTALSGRMSAKQSLSEAQSEIDKIVQELERIPHH